MPTDFATAGRASPTETCAKNGLFWIDSSCFQIPASGFFGNSGFGILSGPGVNNWDTAIEKNITVHETLRVQFRTEFFNAWNHAQFLNPDSNVASVNFGRVLGTRGAREIQFGLKVLW